MNAKIQDLAAGSLIPGHLQSEGVPQKPEEFSEF